MITTNDILEYTDEEWDRLVKDVNDKEGFTNWLTAIINRLIERRNNIHTVGAAPVDIPDYSAEDLLLDLYIKGKTDKEANDQFKFLLGHYNN